MEQQSDRNVQLDFINKVDYRKKIENSHIDAITNHWYNLAFNLLIDYRTRHDKITMVDFALWAYKRGLKRPQNAKPFIRIFEKAVKRNYFIQQNETFINPK